MLRMLRRPTIGPVVRQVWVTRCQKSRSRFCRNIYFAEKKILATLPKMAKAAQSEELRAAFEKHHGETEGQIERLEQVFAAIDKKPQGKTCAAIAQAVEHYEISRYGTLIAWAEELGLDDAIELLEETLGEEEATDEALTTIATTAINQEAKRLEKRLENFTYFICACLPPLEKRHDRQTATSPPLRTQLHPAPQHRIAQAKFEARVGRCSVATTADCLDPK